MGSGVTASDAQVLGQLPDSLIGIGVDNSQARSCCPTINGAQCQYQTQVFDTGDQAVPDALLLDPGDRIKRYDSYNVTGFVPTVTPDELRAAGEAYPTWVVAVYTRLPATVPARVGDLADHIAGDKTNPS